MALYVRSNLRERSMSMRGCEVSAARFYTVKLSSRSTNRAIRLALGAVAVFGLFIRVWNY